MTYMDIILIISGSEETILWIDVLKLYEWIETLDVKWNDTLDWLEKDEYLEVDDVNWDGCSGIRDKILKKTLKCDWWNIEMHFGGKKCSFINFM